MSYPIKISAKTELPSIILIVLAFALGIYFYVHFPAQVATHWNFTGQPNKYSGKLAGAFLLPIIMIALYALFLVLPVLDPRSERYQSFTKVYVLFKNLILGLMLAVFTLSGAYNLGYSVNMNVVVPLIVGILFIIMGNYMGKIKPNWFVGIRTPWTMSSENVWNKTHRFGGKLMVLAGLVIIVDPFLPKNVALAVFITAIALFAFGSVVYSYVAYKKEQK